MDTLSNRINPRVFLIPDYDQGHVTQCWENQDLHRLMSNESSYQPFPGVITAIKETAPLVNYYAEDPSYAMQLRSQLAEYSEVKPENITLGNGSIELLDLLFQVLLTKPEEDSCLLLQPDYSAYIPRLKYFGWNYQTISQADTPEQTVSKLLKNISGKTKFVLFSRPNNPLGTMLPQKEIVRLLETGLIIVVDEAYIELAEPGSSVASWVNDWDNLVVTRTFSKGFCMAGIRLGYIIALPRIIDYINRSRHIFNVNIAAMAAGKATLDLLPDYQRRFKKITSTRDWATDEINNLSGLKALKSQGNFVLVNTVSSGIPAGEYVAVLLDHNFFVRDFSKKAGLIPDGYFRISIGKKEEMVELVNVLEEFVSAK